MAEAEAIRIALPYGKGIVIGRIPGWCFSRPVQLILDGAAAALAVRMCPAVSGYLFAAHQSAEPGHKRLLAAIGHEPLLHLGMRLGEGTGAALAIGIIQAAVAAFTRMATFASAGVSNR